MIRLRSALALLTLALTGCVSLGGPKEPTDIYTLTRTPAAGAPATKLDASVGVNVPHANGLLDSRALLVSPKAGQLQVYAGARWAERPAWLIRRQLLAALSEAGARHAVPAESGALTHYVLESDLDDFDAISEGDGSQGRVQMTLQVRLIDSNTRALVAQHRFHAEQAVTSMQAAAVVAGLSAASSSLTSEVATWTTAQLQHPAMARTESP